MTLMNWSACRAQMSIWDGSGERERQKEVGGTGVGGREGENMRTLVTWKINWKDIHTNTQSKYPNLTVSNTRDPGRNSPG